MHAGIAKLEQQLLVASKSENSFHDFFETLWQSGGTLPRVELRQVIDKATEIIQSQFSSSKKWIATATLGSGFVAFHEGHYDQSLLILTKAQQLFNELKDADGAMACNMMMGCDYRTLGELELAVKALSEAHEQLSATGAYKTFEGFCIYNLGEIYLESKQFDEAMKFQKLALTVCEEAGKEHMRSRIMNAIGLIYQHQKNYALALEWLNKSLLLAKEIDNKPVLARGLTDMGVYFFEMGDFNAARKNQQEALEIRELLQIPNGAITNLIHLAEIDMKQNQFQPAIETLNRALKIAEEIHVKPKAFQIHLMLSEIYLNSGDAIKSLFHYKIYHSLREEVELEDHEKKIKNLQKIFEAEQTKKENAIIKAQKIEIENKNEQLQETIDELTITKVSRKAKVITLFVGITLIVAEEPIFNFILGHIGEQQYLLSLFAKVLIILSLRPIDSAIEKYLLRQLVLKKKHHKNSGM